MASVVDSIWSLCRQGAGLDPQLALSVFLLLTVSALVYHLAKRTFPKNAPINPDHFPSPRPLNNFDITTAKPRPYRPFRWKYHQTMAVMPLEPDWWIELESTYVDRIAERGALYTKYGTAVLDALPGSEAACAELVQMVIRFVTARYPRQFSFNRRSGVFENKILGRKVKLSEVEPLKFLLDHIPEDFMVMQKNEKTGKYYLGAGVSCCAVGWNLGEKMGLALHEIHGPVPLYETSLQTSMDRYFDRLSVNKPIQRGTWSFEVGQPLFLQTNEPHYHFHKRVNPNLKLEDVHLRVDWQTLRRLPESQAIIFNFKAFFYPASDLRREPYIPQLAARVMKETKGNLKQYKGWGIVEHVLIPALDAWADEQRQLGMVPEDWEERTLNAHPFYPGWERQSGFDSKM